MHHALEVEEILLNIFGQCSPSRFENGHPPGSGLGNTADLAALARTCRVFKEPALDVLWSELDGLSPLSRCLPDLSHQVCPGNKQLYSFSRPFNQADWDILRGYTRRVWSIWKFGSGLRWDSIETLLNPPTAGSLFPNLRHVDCTFVHETTPLLHQPLPALISFDITFVLDIKSHDFLKSFSEFSPNIRKLCIQMRLPEPRFGKTVSEHICRWRNLQSVCCPDIFLDIQALAHLSHTPGFVELSFAPSSGLVDQITPSDSVLLFSYLRLLQLRSQSLDSISEWFARTRLPAIADITVKTENSLTKQQLASFLAAVQTACNGAPVTDLGLDQIYSSITLRRYVATAFHALQFSLTLDDLKPIMTFSNLLHLNLNTQWGVDMIDSQLLELVSAWPHLEHLRINEKWGWNTLGGITPDGLVQLLHKCRALSLVSLAIDTRDFTALPPGGVSKLASLGVVLPSTFTLNVVDSIIKAESVTAMAAFLAALIPCTGSIRHAWRCLGLGWHADWAVNTTHWEQVVKEVSKIRALDDPQLLQ